MKPDLFDKPVTLLLGLGIPTEINSVMQAYQVLMDWHNPADPARELALKACRAALSGEIDAQTARAVFVAFAERHDLVAPEISDVLAGRSKGRSDPHIR